VALPNCQSVALGGHLGHRIKMHLPARAVDDASREMCAEAVHPQGENPSVHVLGISLDHYLKLYEYIVNDAHLKGAYD
jgi:hypothetical protein